MLSQSFGLSMVAVRWFTSTRWPGLDVRSRLASAPLRARPTVLVGIAERGVDCLDVAVFHGLPGAMCAVFVPAAAVRSRMICAMKPGPLSERTRTAIAFAKSFLVQPLPRHMTCPRAGSEVISQNEPLRTGTITPLSKYLHRPLRRSVARRRSARGERTRRAGGSRCNVPHRETTWRRRKGLRSKQQRTAQPDRRS